MKRNTSVSKAENAENAENDGLDELVAAAKLPTVKLISVQEVIRRQAALQPVKTPATKTKSPVRSKK